MSVKPIELVVVDFDGTLYNSPQPLLGNSGWWYSAKSLEGFGEPGWDPKWNLPVLIETRRALQSPWTRTVLISTRPQHVEMQSMINGMLVSADLKFHLVQLKPPVSTLSDASFKAGIVQKLILSEPSISKVTMFEDEPANIKAVSNTTKRLSRQFVPMLISAP